MPDGVLAGYYGVVAVPSERLYPLSQVLWIQWHYSGAFKGDLPHITV